MTETYIIDGYNFIRASALFKNMRNDMESARNKLINTVAELSKYENCRISAVFDGKGLPEQYPEHDGFSIIFSGAGTDADSVIEKMVYNAKERLSLIVVTNDAHIRDIVRGAGARVMDTSHFEKLIQTMEKDYGDILTKRSLRAKILDQNG